MFTVCKYVIKPVGRKTRSVKAYYIVVFRILCDASLSTSNLFFYGFTHSLVYSSISLWPYEDVRGLDNFNRIKTSYFPFETHRIYYVTIAHLRFFYCAVRQIRTTVYELTSLR